MMSNEDKPDTNNSKGFRLVEAFGEVLCSRDAEGKPLITIPQEDGPSILYHPEGNTYILQNGKTIASFSYSDQPTAYVEKIKSHPSLVITCSANANNCLLAAARSNKAWVKYQSDFNSISDTFKLVSQGKPIHSAGRMYYQEGALEKPLKEMVGYHISLNLEIVSFLSGCVIEFEGEEYVIFFDCNLGGGKGAGVLLKV